MEIVVYREIISFWVMNLDYKRCYKMICFRKLWFRSFLGFVVGVIGERKISISFRFIIFMSCRKFFILEILF